MNFLLVTYGFICFLFLMGQFIAGAPTVFPTLVSPPERSSPSPQISVGSMLTPKQTKGSSRQRDACVCGTYVPLISLPAFPKQLVSFHDSTRLELCQPVPVISKRSQLCNCADTSNSLSFLPGLCVFTQSPSPFSGQGSKAPATCSSWTA